MLSRPPVDIVPRLFVSTSADRRRPPLSLGMDSGAVAMLSLSVAMLSRFSSFMIDSLQCKGGKGRGGGRDEKGEQREESKCG